MLVKLPVLRLIAVGVILGALVVGLLIGLKTGRMQIHLSDIDWTAWGSMQASGEGGGGAPQSGDPADDVGTCRIVQWGQNRYMFLYSHVIADEERAQKVLNKHVDKWFRENPAVREDRTRERELMHRETTSPHMVVYVKY